MPDGAKHKSSEVYIMEYDTALKHKAIHRSPQLWNAASPLLLAQNTTHETEAPGKELPNKDLGRKR